MPKCVLLSDSDEDVRETRGKKGQKKAKSSVKSKDKLCSVYEDEAEWRDEDSPGDDHDGGDDGDDHGENLTQVSELTMSFHLIALLGDDMVNSLTWM
jgi:hypothetical protein